MKLAPIVLFVYNRPWHTMQTVMALQQNVLAKESELFMYSDASANEKNVVKVNEVRDYIRTIGGFKEITIIEREKNWGLAASIIDGVTDIVNKFGKIIVLEDDLVTSHSFLKFMNEALDIYKKEQKIASIHGYVYPINNLPETFFIKGADCWGWATWARAWKYFEPDGKKLLREIKNNQLQREADFNYSYGYVKMLKKQIQDKNSSWAIRWSISIFLKEMLTLYPSVSYVQNIGDDSSGTHCGTSDVYRVQLNNDSKFSKIDIAEDLNARKKFEDFFKSIKKNIAQQLLSKMKDIPMKLFVKSISPPVFSTFINNLRNRKYGWKGSYSTWQDAKSEAIGYEDNSIVEKVRNALLKVKNGEVAYERDSKVFSEIEYSWPLVTGLMLASANNRNGLSVMDFGGSLGSTYFQNKKFLDILPRISWSIIEQNHFVDIGKKEFEDEHLHFYYDIDKCMDEEKPSVLLLSSVLQYIESPYQLLDRILKHEFEYILIDRTPFSFDNRDKIKLQIVPPSIYEASYPCWFFNKQFFIDFFHSKSYKLIEEFESIDGKGKECIFKGMILKKNDSSTKKNI